MEEKLSPEETARFLRREGFTIQDYDEIQEQRKERLKTFQSAGIKALIDAEKDLIAYGEEVIKILKAI